MQKLKFFDISLRDGLQSIKKIYSLSEKKELYHKIINKHIPTSVEIGSLVSPKILPQMKDSIELFKHTQTLCMNNSYILTPNYKSVQKGLEHKIKNFSLITSVSDEFQKKNINKTLLETKKDLSKSLYLLNIAKAKNVKLYISCISECPIKGEIDVNIIINEIIYYLQNYNTITELCISDTCGTLKFEKFKYILDKLIHIYDQKENSKIQKLSLHLHKNKNYEETEKIIKYAYDNKIYKYDVSCLKDVGGCSVTMDKNKMNTNLHYDDIHSILFP
jgi:hydroxymethylglutaryl-CoA lyase